MSSIIDTVSWLAPDGSAHFQWTEQTDLAGGRLRIIDQRKLPESLVYLDIDSIEDACEAIQTLAVRGAPAIGCAAGLALAAAAGRIAAENTEDFFRRLREYSERLGTSRPTAVNLSWALNRCMNHLEKRRRIKNLFRRNFTDEPPWRLPERPQKYHEDHHGFVYDPEHPESGHGGIQSNWY